MGSSKELAARIISQIAAEEQTVPTEQMQTREQSLSSEQGLPAFFVEDETRGHEGPEGREMKRVLEACKVNDPENGFVAVGNRDSYSDPLEPVALMVQGLRDTMQAVDESVRAMRSAKQRNYSESQIRHHVAEVIKAQMRSRAEQLGTLRDIGGVSLAFGKIIEGADAPRLVMSTVGNTEAYIVRKNKPVRIGSRSPEERANLANQRLGDSAAQIGVFTYKLEPGDRVVLFTQGADKTRKLNESDAKQLIREGGHVSAIEQALQEQAARKARDHYDEHASNLFSAVVMDVPREAEHAGVAVREIPDAEQVISKKETSPQAFPERPEPSRRELFLKTKRAEIQKLVGKLAEELRVQEKRGGSEKEILGTKVLLAQEKGRLAEKDYQLARYQEDKAEAEIPPLFTQGQKGIQEVDPDGLPTSNTLTVRHYNAGSRNYTLQRHGPSGQPVGESFEISRFRFDSKYATDDAQEQALYRASLQRGSMERARKQQRLAEDQLRGAKRKWDQISYQEQESAQRSQESEQVQEMGFEAEDIQALEQARQELLQHKERLQLDTQRLRDVQVELRRLGPLRRETTDDDTRQIHAFRQEERDLRLRLGIKGGSLRGLAQQLSAIDTQIKDLDARIAA